MGAIYDTLLRLFLTDERLSEVGLTNAVLKNWITEEEKLVIVNSKGDNELIAESTDNETTL